MQNEQELALALRAMVRRLCERDAEVARMVGAIGRLLSEVAGNVGGVVTGGGVLGPSSSVPSHDGSTADGEKPGTEPVSTSVDKWAHPAPMPPPATVILKLGGCEKAVQVSGTPEEIERARRSAPVIEPKAQPVKRPTPAPTLPDLSLVARRCRLKASGCQVAAALARASSEQEKERAMKDRSRLLDARQSLFDCFLWMFHDNYRAGADELVLLGKCYENLALACEIAVGMPRRDRAEFREALALLAEAQSAVRKGLRDAWIMLTDRDQDDAFQWLDRVTNTEQIYIERHMRLNDPADPAGHADLRARLEAMDRRIEEANTRSREEANLLNKVRYHADQIAQPGEEDRAYDWGVVSKSVRKLEDVGVVPGDDRLAEALHPILLLPEEQWRGSEDLKDLLRTVREVMETGADSTAEPEAARPESAEVAQVREWLRDKRAVLIGGKPIPHAEERIRRAFGLSELEWVELTEHGRTDPIEPPIAKPETAVVWVAIRLTGHLHADVVAETCRRYNKPLVRLPGGFNPSQIAARTIEQVSERLSAGSVFQNG